MSDWESSLQPHRTLHFSPSDAGARLLDALTDCLVDLGTGSIRSLLEAGCVRHGEVELQGGYRIEGHETVTVEIPEGPLVRLRPRPLEGFEVLYEDAAVLVAMKPAGVGVTPDRGDFEAPFLGACLEHLARTTGANPPPRPRVVHRLDKDTSGAVIVARSREALRDLTQQFQDGTVRKDYLALTLGAPYKDDGEIDLPIGREARGVRLRAGGKDAREACTRFTVVERFRGYGLVRAWPVTGRQHQIRVHLEAVGHPLAVDPLYGGQEGVLLSSFKSKYVPNRTGKERPLMDRLSLHAEAVTFRSPDSGEELRVEAPLPKDFRITLKQLRRWAPERGGRR